MIRPELTQHHTAILDDLLDFILAVPPNPPPNQGSSGKK